MKKGIVLLLAAAMVLALAGCGCDHAQADWQVTAVDTQALTMDRALTCSQCGKVTQTETLSTGAPGALTSLSPSEWFSCLHSNITAHGANQSLIPYAAESEDNALIKAIVSLSGMQAVITYRDEAGTTLTVDQADQRGLIRALSVEAQFTNECAKDFFNFLMLVAINNNSSLDLTAAGDIAQRIMGMEPVSDNGYTYQLEILSAEDHTVGLLVTAE